MALSTSTVTSAFSVMDATYDRLANRLSKEHLGKPNHQHWVAIAGGPGSGKSTTAEDIADRLNSLQKDSCVVLPMDGFHYSQSKMKELDPPNGEEYIKRKGAPWTFDAERCVELLTKAKQDMHASFPIYDRTISDTVDGGVELLRSHQVVLVEGLYVLWKDDERWAPLDPLWDEKWFVKAPSFEIQRQRLVDRSLLTWSKEKTEMWGPAEEGAVARIDANDAPNMKIVEPCEKYAEVVVETKSE
jgi:pantothenate kinase